MSCNRHPISGDDEVMTPPTAYLRWFAGYDVSNAPHPVGAPMAHERSESLTLGRLVVEQRHHLSLSQTDVVRRIHNAAKAEGRQSGATKQWISEIERTGRIPHPDELISATQAVLSSREGRGPLRAQLGLRRSLHTLPSGMVLPYTRPVITLLGDHRWSSPVSEVIST